MDKLSLLLLIIIYILN